MSKTQQATRSKKTSDVTPDRVIEWLGEAISRLSDASFEQFPFGCKGSYMETEQARLESISVFAVYAELAAIMASHGKYFSSDYRHGIDAAHSRAYRAVGGMTVYLNALIEKNVQEHAAA